MTARTPRALLLLALSACAACAGTAAGSRDGTATAAPTARDTAARPITFAELAALPAPPADHRIAYGDAPEQFGELRLPQGDGRVPIVVLIHGGCWLQAYDVAHTRPLATALARAGHAVWSPEYRRVGGAGGHPNTFADVAAAVDSVRMLARRFPRLDTTRTVLAGHSAGGHLALWAAARMPGEALDGAAVAVAPLRPAGVVSLAGIADLAAYAAGTGSCNRSVVPLLGGTPAEVPARYAAASPVSKPPAVPVRIVHGAADPIVPLAQSEALVRAAPGRVTFDTVAGAGHFDVVAPRGASFDALLRAIEAIVGR